MNRQYGRIEPWGAAITGVVLVGLPAVGWIYGGSLSWMDSVVALIGIAALVSAVESLLRRRRLTRALQTPQVRGRHAVCPRSGEPLMEDV